MGGSGGEKWDKKLEDKMLLIWNGWKSGTG